MKNLIASIILIIIIACAIYYIVKQKKEGVKCIGCPYSGNCPSKNSNGQCNCNEKTKS